MHYRIKGPAPYKHQIETLKFLHERAYAAVYSEPGTGKTRSLVCAAEAKKMQGVVCRALYVCPDAVRETAGVEIQRWTDLSVTVLRGSSEERVKQLRETDSFFYVLNYESCPLILEELVKKSFDLVIMDESTRIKNPKANRTKALATIVKKCKVRWQATGSPMPTNPLDIHGQYSLLDRRILGDSDFFKRTFIQYKKGTSIKPVIAGYKNMDRLKRIMDKFSIRYLKDECLDLPDKVFVEHLVPLSDLQTRIYKELEEQFVSELPSGETVSISNVMSKYMRLQQITSGFVGSGEEADIFDDTRIRHLQGIVEMINPDNEKIIIWCSYTPSIHRIAKVFKRLNPAFLYGEVSDKQGQIDKFNNHESCRILIGNSKVGIGCTMNVAAYTIYYELPYFDTEAMIQSQDRNHRIGQKRKVTYYTMISPGTIDRTISSNLNKKFKLAEFLTGDDVKKMLKGEV